MFREVKVAGRRTVARLETRRAVLEAASRLLHSRGFQATTIRDIANEAGVSVGTVMSVGDKEALLVELFDGLISERQETVDAQVFTGGACCDADAVAVVEPFAVLFEEHRDLAQTYASIIVSGRHSSVVFTDLANRLTSVFEQLLTVCGCSSSGEVQSRANALYSAYIGSLFIWSATSEIPAHDYLVQLSRVFATICHHERGI